LGNTGQDPLLFTNTEPKNVLKRLALMVLSLQSLPIGPFRGGGLRAMIALQGILGELQKQDLLDIVMYLCGVSGSTCSIYFEGLPSLEDKLCHKLVNPHRDWNKALKSLVESSKDDTYSLTDFWGNVVVYIMLHEVSIKNSF
uniref:Uncharacterized protein n=1 Tax=Naja naja TaxID=35670 RepID=A0A8C6X944_NAJNA